MPSRVKEGGNHQQNSRLRGKGREVSGTNKQLYDKERMPALVETGDGCHGGVTGDTKKDQWSAEKEVNA